MARSGPSALPAAGRATAPQLRFPARGSPAGPLPKPGPPPARPPRPQQSGESCGIYPGLPGAPPAPGAGGTDPADPLGAACSHPPPVHPRPPNEQVPFSPAPSGQDRVPKPGQTETPNPASEP